MPGAVFLWETDCEPKDNFQREKNVGIVFSSSSWAHQSGAKHSSMCPYLWNIMLGQAISKSKLYSQTHTHTFHWIIKDEKEDTMLWWALHGDPFSSDEKGFSIKPQAPAKSSCYRAVWRVQDSYLGQVYGSFPFLAWGQVRARWHVIREHWLVHQQPWEVKIQSNLAPWQTQNWQQVT